MCNECGYKHSEDNEVMSIVICGDCLRELVNSALIVVAVISFSSSA